MNTPPSLADTGARQYVDTERLLADAFPDESSLAQQIGDSHKEAYLAAINDHVVNGHPVFTKSGLALS